MTISFGWCNHVMVFMPSLCLCLVKAEVVSPRVHMERESSHNNPLQLMSLNFGASNTPQDDQNQKMIMGTGSSENQNDPFAVPWMVQSSMPAQNCVDFLAESSAYLPKSPYEDMLERISLSVNGIHAADGGVSEFQRDLLYGSSLGKASGSKSIDFSMDMDPWKVTVCIYVIAYLFSGLICG